MSIDIQVQYHVSRPSVLFMQQYALT